MIGIRKQIIVKSCADCPYIGYTESNFYCKNMSLGKYSYMEISDKNNIHKLCPLDDMTEE